MAQTFTETVAMLDLVIGHLDNPGNATTLTAKGLDVPATKTRLTAKKNSLVQLDAEQEALKVALQNKTIAVEAATADGYIDASGMVDAIVENVWDEDNPAHAPKLAEFRLARHVLRIRS